MILYDEAGSLVFQYAHCMVVACLLIRNGELDFVQPWRISDESTAADREAFLGQNSIRIIRDDSNGRVRVVEP